MRRGDQWGRSDRERGPVGGSDGERGPVGEE